MSSQWTILTSFIYKVPVLRLNTSDTSSFKFKRSFFWTNTSVFIITVNMWTLTFHAFPCFSYPEIWWITFYTDIIWWQIWWLCWTFTFSSVHVVNKSLRTSFAFQANVIPEIWWIAWNTDIILSIRSKRRTLTFFSYVIIVLSIWTNYTDHSGPIIMTVLWASVTFIIFKEWSIFWARCTISFESIINLFIWALKASSLIWIPVTRF